MKYPFERQSDLKDCGVCSLLMITRYYGGKVSKEYLRILTNTTKEGTSAYSLIEGAKTLGFTAKGIKGEIEKLEEDYLPCIAHVVIHKSYQHFLVIYRINKKKRELLIADPAKKEVTKMNFSEFKKISTNHFILLKPQKKIEYVEKNSFLKNQLFSFMKERKKVFVIMFVVSFLIIVFYILSSFQFKLLFEYVINYQSLENVWLLALIFLGVILLKECSNYYRNYVMNTINHHLDKTLISNVYHHILSLPHLYYKNRTTGEMVARLNDLASIREVIGKSFVTIILDFMLAIFILITLFFLNSDLSIIVVIFTLLMIIVIMIFQRPLERKIRMSKEEGAKLNSFLVETIAGLETIRNQGIEEYIEGNFKWNYSKYSRNSHSYNQLYILEDFITNIIQECGTLIIMLVGTYLTVKLKLNVATFITYITLLGYLMEPIKNIVGFNIALKDAKASFKRIEELYEVEIEEKKSKKINMQSNDMVVKHLTFSYNNKDYILKDINLDIPTGSRILIYGSSGSGKSTLAKVLSKKLKISNQMVYYDRRDLNYYASGNVIREICYISEHETIFTDSIYQNIIMDQEVEEDVFYQVANECLVTDLYKKNNLAYDMLLEEDGCNVSGGERQRIILARAMLRDAKVYIFDEALNKIDIEKERIILQTLFHNYPNKTFIVISHRFHNQDLFTKKYQIEEGMIYEKCLDYS